MLADRISFQVSFSTHMISRLSLLIAVFIEPIVYTPTFNVPLVYDTLGNYCPTN